MAATIPELVQLGAVLTPVGATAVGITWLWLKYGKGNGKCPIPAHEKMLTEHDVQITSFKEWLTKVEDKLDRVIEHRK